MSFSYLSLIIRFNFSLHSKYVDYLTHSYFFTTISEAIYDLNRQFQERFYFPMIESFWSCTIAIYITVIMPKV